jgi:carboxypeptidase C (cathepsin A)
MAARLLDVWLHMGAFGPRRVVTKDDSHTPAAPYQLVDNAYSLLDATDLVFIDAPGTGFSRIAGKDKEKAFYGVDPDAYAFSRFHHLGSCPNTAAGIRPNICSARAMARRDRPF